MQRVRISLFFQRTLFPVDFCGYCTKKSSFIEHLSQDKLPVGYWRSTENQQRFIDFITKEYFGGSKEAWSHVTSRKLKDMGGEGLIKQYGTFNEVKKYCFPNVEVDIPSKDKQRAILENLESSLGIEKTEDWFYVTKSDLKKFGVSYIVGFYPSVYHMITELFSIPLPLSFDKPVPSSYWDNVHNQRLFMDSIGKKLGINCLSDWEKVNFKDITSVGGKRILKRYSSLFDALSSIYPEHDWQLFGDRKLPSGFWKEIHNQKAFLNWFATKNNIKSFEDWGVVTNSMICEAGGRSLFTIYTTLFNALVTVFPEKKWDVFNFQKLPAGYWESEENIIGFLERLKVEYSIKNDEDWYRISRKQVIKVGGNSLLVQFGGLGNIVKKYLPGNWDMDKFKQRDKRSEQRELFLYVLNLFPNDEVIEDYFHEELTRISGAPVQFDIFIPSKSIAIEYHGIHHFNEIASFGNLELYQQRDREKEELCKNNGIKLYIVEETTKIDNFLQKIN